MIILTVTLRLRAPWCQGLKDKRSVTKPLLHKLRQTFNVSAVESGAQDLHTLIELTIAALAFDSAQADSIEENLYRFVAGNTDAEIVAWEVEVW
ncbi:MAG: DUF503 domain-containing protein [Clostridiales bacterium]|nr:DUF503 domain-containing protein [Clostridiales bacterium]